MSLELKTLNLMVTSRCNCHCSCCYQQLRDEELDLKTLAEVVHAASCLGCETIMLSGGEPFLRNDIWDIIAECKTAGMQTWIPTNGTLITAVVAERIAQLGVDQISIGFDPAGHGEPGDKDSISRQKTIEAFKILAASGVSTAANIIVTPRTIGKLDQALHQLYELGVTRINLLRPKPAFDSSWFHINNLEASQLLLLQSLRIKLFLKYPFPHGINYDCAFSLLGYGIPETTLREVASTGCSAGISYCTVAADGSVYPCPDFKSRRFNCGNVFYSSLDSIWNHSELLERFRNAGRIKGYCGECRIHDWCRGCRALAWHSCSDEWSSDPDCPFGSGSSVRRVYQLLPMYAHLGRVWWRNRKKYKQTKSQEGANQKHAPSP